MRCVSLESGRYGCVYFAVQRTIAAAVVLPTVVGAVTPIVMVSVSAVKETLCVVSEQDVFGTDVSSISHVTVVSAPFLRTVYLKPLLLAGGASMRIRKSESVPETVMSWVTSASVVRCEMNRPMKSPWPVVVVGSPPPMMTALGPVDPAGPGVTRGAGRSGTGGCGFASVARASLAWFSKPPGRSAEEVEDRLLAAEARKALADPEDRERIPWERLKAELGL